MKYWIKNDLSKMLDDRFTLDGELIFGYRGRNNFVDYPANEWTEIDVDADINHPSRQQKYYKLVDGIPSLMSQAEIDSFDDDLLKEKAKKDAKDLYDSMKLDCKIVTYNSVEYDLTDSFMFDYQQRKKSQNIKVHRHKGTIDVLSKADADNIELLVAGQLETLSDAFIADMAAIEAGDYSLSNMEAL